MGWTMLQGAKLPVSKLPFVTGYLTRVTVAVDVAWTFCVDVWTIVVVVVSVTVLEIVEVLGEVTARRQPEVT
jgi:hypothetical protein